MAQGFSVAVKLVDLATGPLANINKAIKELDSNAKKASGTGRSIQARDALNAQKERLEKIKKTRDGLKDLRDKADDVSDSFRKMFGPLGLQGIGTLASAGGIALASVRFAQLGSEMVRTSATLGLSTAGLEKWRGAADLAGVGADTMTTSIAGVAQGIYRVRNGLDPDMFRVARRWSLDLNRGTTDAEKGMNTILQVAHKIRNDPDLKGNTQAQKTLLEQLHIDPRMLWLMQQGEEKMKEFAEISRQHIHLTDQQYDSAMQLQFAYNGLTQSVSGFTNVVAADMSKWMTPMLGHLSTWLDRLKESPGAMKAVEVAGEALFIGSVARWAPALIRLAGNVTGLTKALTFLFKIPGMSLLGPLGAFAGTLYGGSLNEGENEAVRKGSLYPRMYRHGAGVRINGRGALQPWQLSRADEARGRKERAQLAFAHLRARGIDEPHALAMVANGLAESGLDPAQIGDNGTSRGAFQWHADRGAAMQSTLGGKASNLFAQLDYAVADQKKRDPGWFSRPGTAETLTGSFEHGFEAPKIETGRLSYLDEAKRAIARPGAAASQAQPEANANATVRVRTGTGTLKFTKAEYDAYVRETGNQPALAPGAALPPGWAAPSYAPAVPSITESGGLARGGTVGPQGMLDTSHRVEVHFVNAPPGMRTGLTKAMGPAEVSVRTHYSMDDLS